MKVTVLIPARDEQKTILELLTRVKRELVAISGEILVIDDGSQDATAELARNVPGVKVIRHPGPHGKGAALRTGLAQAQGEITIIQDADLEYNPEDFPALILPIELGRADVVYGSRVLGARQGRAIGKSNLRFYWGGRFLSWLTSVLYGVRITDMPTGYKVFKTEVLRAVSWQADGFEFCPEITARILKKRIPLVEIPIAYTPRSFAEGKKIRWQDGWIAIRTLWKFRWGAGAFKPAEEKVRI